MRVIGNLQTPSPRSGYILHVFSLLEAVPSKNWTDKHSTNILQITPTIHGRVFGIVADDYDDDVRLCLKLWASIILKTAFVLQL